MGVFCRSTLNYSTATGERAALDVDILDGRTAGLPNWTVCGFELLHHSSAVSDWADDTEVAAVHHPELEALARRLTGCDHACVWGHIRRSPDAAARHRDLAPIRFVHSDFASGYDDIIRRSFRHAHGERPTEPLTRDGLTLPDVDDAERIVVVQFWRNLGPARMDLPIAFCDARTVRPDETRTLVVTDYAGAGGPDFEALAVTPPDEPSRHAWYAFPELRPDEVVAFRTYDTDLVRDGGTFFTPHSAFRDPDVALGEPARTSIELRAICLFA